MGALVVSRQWTRDEAGWDHAFNGIMMRGWPTCKSTTSAAQFDRCGGRRTSLTANANDVAALIDFSEANEHAP